jgi:uncharacterized protein YegL
MPSEFEKVLDEIRKRSSKYEDIGDVKGEIIKNIVEVYKRQLGLFTEILERGGFDLGDLNQKQSPREILSDFLSLCNGLRREKLYKIFGKLYEQNSGISLLREIRDLLGQPENQRIDIPTGTKKILFLSANPKGTSQLRLDEEIREIKEGLRRSKKREGFAIETGHAVRYREIWRAILDSGPNIVHFSGHGLGDEGLVFEDEAGQQKLVGAEALAGLFKLFADQIECVVLNVCYSEVQARAIVEHIPFVVGMNKAIGDRAAIEFAIGFYDGLGAGKTVEFAYELGCNSIKMAGIPEHLTPQLLRKNSIDIFSIDIPKKDSPRHSTKSKIPVVLLLDTSSSMLGQRIDSLNAGIAAFKEEFEPNTNISQNLELAIVTCNSNRETFQGFVNMDNFIPVTLEAEGETKIGKGIDSALDNIENYQEYCQKNNFQYRKPLLLLIIGGSPTDDWRNSAERVRQVVEANRLNFFVVGVKGADMTSLRQIAPPQTPPKTLDNFKFRELFQWLADYLKKVSSSEKGTRIRPLPTTEWEASE